MMLGFLLIVAWVLFAVIVAHQQWPRISRWVEGGERQFSIESSLGQHRHRESDDTVPVQLLLERYAA